MPMEVSLSLIAALGSSTLFLTLLTTGAVKLFGSAVGTDKIWIPRSLRSVPSRTIVIAIAFAELALATSIVVTPGRDVYVMVMLALCLMMVYGLASLQATGTCSCAPLHVTRKRSLLARNGFLVGLALALAVAEPRRPTIVQLVVGVLVTGSIGLTLLGGGERRKAGALVPERLLVDGRHI